MPEPSITSAATPALPVLRATSRTSSSQRAIQQSARHTASPAAQLELPELQVPPSPPRLPLAIHLPDTIRDLPAANAYHVVTSFAVNEATNAAKRARDLEQAAIDRPERARTRSRAAVDFHRKNKELLLHELAIRCVEFLVSQALRISLEEEGSAPTAQSDAFRNTWTVHGPQLTPRIARDLRRELARHQEEIESRMAACPKGPLRDKQAQVIAYLNAIDARLETIQFPARALVRETTW